MFTKIVNELSELYKVEKYTVIDTLKSSIEEVLTYELGYKVNAVVEEDNINLIAEINQHGVINYQNLSKYRIKEYHIAEITKLLNFKLHENEAKVLYNRYSLLRASLVSGKLIKPFKDTHIVKLENIDNSNDEVIAFCENRYLLPNDIKNSNSINFQVTSVGVVIEENIFRVLITLTRINKHLPILILKNLDQANKSKNIRCVERIAGKFSILQSDSKISKTSLQQLQSEFYGEYFRVEVRKPVVVANV